MKDGGEAVLFPAATHTLASVGAHRAQTSNCHGLYRESSGTPPDIRGIRVLVGFRVEGSGCTGVPRS